MVEPHYLTLLDRYRDRLTSWTSESELWRLVRAAYVSEAEALLRETGQLVAPFDPVLGMRNRHVNEFKFIADLPQEGKLIPNSTGFSVWMRTPTGNIRQLGDLSGKKFPARLRTTLAHELGHTFFFDLSKFPPTPFVNHFSLTDHQHASDEEWWCMDFARAYLIPKFWVETELRRTMAPSLRTAVQMKATLAVSWDLLFRRLIWDLNYWHNCVAFVANRSSLKVLGLWKSPEMKNWSFIHWYRSMGKSSVLSQGSGGPVGREKTERIDLDQLGRFTLTTLSFPNSQNVICMLAPDEDRSLDAFVPTFP